MSIITENASDFSLAELAYLLRAELAPEKMPTGDKIDPLAERVLDETAVNSSHE